MRIGRHTESLRAGLLFGFLLVGFARPAPGQTGFEDVRARALLSESTSWGLTWWESEARRHRGRSTKLSVGAARLYGLPELTVVQTGLRRNSDPLSLAFELASFGYADFRQTSAAGAVLVRPGKIRPLRTSAGIRAAFFHLSPRGYSGVSALRVDAVWSTLILEDLSLTGGAIGLLHQDRLERAGISRTMVLGAVARLTDGAFVIGEFAKDGVYPASLRLGIEVAPATDVSLRFGAATEPARMAMGIGIGRGLVVVDLAAEKHHALGISSCVSLTLGF